MQYTLEYHHWSTCALRCPQCEFGRNMVTKPQELDEKTVEIWNRFMWIISWNSLSVTQMISAPLLSFRSLKGINFSGGRVYLPIGYSVDEILCQDTDGQVVDLVKDSELHGRNLEHLGFWVWARNVWEIQRGASVMVDYMIRVWWLLWSDRIKSYWCIISINSTWTLDWNDECATSIKKLLWEKHWHVRDISPKGSNEAVRVFEFTPNELRVPTYFCFRNQHLSSFRGDEMQKAFNWFWREPAVSVLPWGDIHLMHSPSNIHEPGLRISYGDVCRILDEDHPYRSLHRHILDKMEEQKQTA